MNAFVAMLAIVAMVAVGFALLALAWNWFERRWDRDLFRAEPGGTYRNVRARAAHGLLQADPKMQVLDVRSQAEFARGALPGAIHISVGEPGFPERLGGLDVSRPVLVYCAGGYRSRKAVATLRERGFATVYHLHRGFHSWDWAGLPVERQGAGPQGGAGSKDQGKGV